MKYVLIAMLLLFTSCNEYCQVSNNWKNGTTITTGEYKVIIECEDPEWYEDVVEEWHDYNN